MPIGKALTAAQKAASINIVLETVTATLVGAPSLAFGAELLHLKVLIIHGEE